MVNPWLGWTEERMNLSTITRERMVKKTKNKGISFGGGKIPATKQCQNTPTHSFNTLFKDYYEQYT